MRVIPAITVGCGAAAFLGAMAHILFLEPGYRPWLLPLHGCLILLGLYWWRNKPSNPVAASAITGVYLSSVICLYILFGEFTSTVHLGILIVGGLYLSLDRRLLLILSATWLIWLTVIASVWLPQREGLPVLIICFISTIGGAALRKIRLTGIEEVVSLQAQLEQTVAEREQAIQRAKEAEKMESLGVMAAGVAHDYNNLLVGIVGGADLVAHAETQDDREFGLHMINTSADALSGLSAQLLELSGGRPINKVTANLNTIVERTIATLGGEANTAGRIHCTLDPDIPLVLGEPASLQQVILNLTTNALEAASTNPGSVRIGTQTEPNQQSEGSKNVLLWVEDDGPGIPESDRSRIYDPFFTTREGGHGLGLATSRAIIDRHNAALQLCPLKNGARFEVRFPGMPRDDQSVLPSSIPDTKNLQSENVQILLVDDDTHVRQVTARMLGQLGFDVIEASSGEQAIAQLDDASLAIQLAVVDALMPGIDGPETISQLRRLMPTLPIVLYSGYHYTENQAPDLPADVCFLAKPFNIEKLKDTLLQVMPELDAGTTRYQ